MTLHTRKKKHGTRTPRIIPMTQTLYKVLLERYFKRERDIPWIFWHRFYSRKAGGVIVGPYQDRKKFMKTLCTKAQVPYFRFHPLRHAGASFMESIGIPIAHIQDILGHENRKTTEGYIHSTNQNNKQAIIEYENARKAT